MNEKQMLKKSKGLTLWKTDFKREQDWFTVCDVLGAPRNTKELELSVIGCYKRSHHRHPVPDAKKCPRCGGPLSWSDIPQYTYQCFTCDEDFYNIEVK